VSRVYKLIVTDTSPLITLAVANELDVLLRAGVPIEIPDAVYIEATRVRTAPGANQIGAWINDHSDLVRIVPTETGVDQQRRLEEGRPIRGMGEQASIETLDIFLAKNPDAQALLLFEDSDISKRRAIVDERVSLISTGDFLRELQNAHLIQSAEHILDEAACSGRNVEKQREPATDVEARETLRRQLQDRHRGTPGMER
jgi:predicted nucleic acid-binding protein